ncbi:hypothetical protein ScPMuIL_017344 [Solemya velum]
MIFSFIILVVTVVAADEFPEGYYMNLTAICSPKGSDGEYAIINLYTNLYAEPTAVCWNRPKPHMELNYVTFDHFNLKVFYRMQEMGDNCYFERNGSSYDLGLQIGWNYDTAWHHSRFQISCSNYQTVHLVIDPSEYEKYPMALHESHWGDVAHDDVTLQVVDVLMRPIDKIMLGRKVHLRASITGNTTARGLRPVSCLAHDMNNTAKYIVLQAGCGTGVHLALHEGFTTKGTVATSPVFKFTSLYSSMHAVNETFFRCSFVFCNEECDGTSCYREKLRQTRHKELNDG